MAGHFGCSSSSLSSLKRAKCVYKYPEMINSASFSPRNSLTAIFNSANIHGPIMTFSAFLELVQ